MTDLVSFLRAQLAADEAAAKAASEWWDSDREAGYLEWPSAEGSAHIARHDPARVLADVEVKRRVVELHAESAPPYGSADQQVRHEELEEVLRLLAQPYAGQEGWQEEWRVL